MQIKQPIRFTDIDDFSDYYTFTKDGKVFVTSTGRECIEHINKDGYHYFNLYDKNGRIKHLRKHRIVAALNLDLPEDHHYLTVNHKDGDKSNNYPDNLEWMTVANNRKHAAKEKLDITRTCQFRSSITGTVLNFPSIAKAAEHFDLTKDDIKYRAFSSTETEHLNYGLFRIPASNDPWPEPTPLYILDIKRNTPDGVDLRNIKTGELKSFKQQFKAAEFLKIPVATLSVNMTKFKQPILGDWQVKLMLDIGDWIPPEVIEKKRYLEGTLQKVKVIDRFGKETIYDSAAQAAKTHGLLRTTLNERLKFGKGKIWKDGNQYFRYEPYGGSALVETVE